MANTLFLMALRKPLRVLLGLLLLYDHHHGRFALAASCGRMGGDSFSSSSSSRSSSTRTPFKDSWFYIGLIIMVAVFPESLEIIWFFLVVLLIMVAVLPESLGIICFFLVVYRIIIRITTEKSSVVKLQVGLSGNGRSLQKDLNHIAEVSDTSKPQGLRYVLQETTLALLRHPDACISGYASVDVKRGVQEGEKRFHQLSMEERVKCDEETLVNVNNIRKQSATTQRSNDFPNEYIVITIIVVVEGVHKLPRIKNHAKLKETLQKLMTIPSSKVKAVEVLWTPQSENDTLTERELFEKYWLLRRL